jgi:hypothetical protein
VLLSSSVAAAQTLEIAAEVAGAVDAPPADAAPPAPSAPSATPSRAPDPEPEEARRHGIDGWLGGHLVLGAGTEWVRGVGGPDVVPAVEYSMTFGFVRVGSRLTWGVRKLEAPDGDALAWAQTIRGEWSVAFESDVGPYVGARMGVAHTWDLPPDASGATARTSPIFALDAGLSFPFDEGMRLGIGASYFLEPDASDGALIELRFQGRVFDS